MTVVAHPDVLGCLIGYLRAVPEVAALASTRISGAVQADWAPMPRHAVWLAHAGGPGADLDVDHLLERIDVHCYGATAYEAMRLWRIVDPSLVPTRQGGNASSIKRTVGGQVCLIYHLIPEGGPIGLVEQDSGWPRVTCSYIARAAAVPA